MPSARAPAMAASVALAYESVMGPTPQKNVMEGLALPLPLRHARSAAQGLSGDRA